jgi:hypothetical protein
MNYTLLRVLVGSRAHGTFTSKSDWDYRAVHIAETRNILKLYVDVPDTIREVEDDELSYELGHFLHLALKCNPTILEILSAKPLQSYSSGLQDLFFYFLDTEKICSSFLGYANSQRERYVQSANPSCKYAQAYLITLYQGCELLRTGKLPLDMHGTPIYDTLISWRASKVSLTEINEICLPWLLILKDMKNQHPGYTQNTHKINEYLLDMRLKFW